MVTRKRKIAVSLLIVLVGFFVLVSAGTALATKSDDGKKATAEKAAEKLQGDD